MPPRIARSLLIGLAVSACNDEPGTHIDCFGGLYCVDGEVLREERSPVPVSAGACPRARVYTCARGCALSSAPLDSKPEALCAGAPGDAPGDGRQRDAGKDTTIPVDSPRAKETGGADGAAVACTTEGAPCAGGLTCQCCGSIGPKAICICSKACSADGECQGTALPSCNKATPSSPGICTPPGFNCCWMCQ